MICNEIQDTLIDYRYGDLAREHRRHVALHLTTCPTCALAYCQLEADLAGLSAELEVEPRPELARALRRRVETRFSRPWYTQPWHLLRAPLPVYQAAICVMAVVLVFAWITPGKTVQTANPAPPAAAAIVLDHIDASTLHVVDSNVL